MSSSEEDIEDAIQKDLLDCLAKYGDSLLEGEDKSKKKKKLSDKGKKVTKDRKKHGDVQEKNSSPKFENLNNEKKKKKNKPKKEDVGVVSKLDNVRKDEVKHKVIIEGKKKKTTKVSDNPGNSNSLHTTDHKTLKTKKIKPSAVTPDTLDDDSDGESDFNESENSWGDEFDSLGESSDTECVSLEKQPRKLTKKQKELLKMKEALGLLDEDFLKSQEKKKKEEQNVKNKGCGADHRAVQKRRPPPEIVVFEQPSKRKRQKEAPPTSTEAMPTPEEAEPTSSRGPEFDIKSARHEVQRFGITGLEGEGKEDAVTAMLVRLGAKPAKKECINYKKLQEKKKEQKEGAQEKREWDRSMGFKVSSSAKRYSANRASQKRDRNDVGVLDGQVGSYRGGVQRLSKDDFTAITKAGKKGKGRK